MARKQSLSQIRHKINNYIFAYASPRDLVILYNFIFVEEEGSRMRVKDILKEESNDKRNNNKEL
jgi:hypothetical protein